MNFWVHTASTYWAPAILGRVHTAFLTFHQFNKMTYMPDDTVLARILTALDIEFEKALHYDDEGYESDKDYGLPTQNMEG